MSDTLTKEPVTHAGTAPTDLVGRLVRVRPFYHVPVSRSCLRSTRSAFTFEAHVIDTFSTEMVKVRFDWASDSAPWRREAVFYPKELHLAYGQCQCAACAGDGIGEHSGA